ncbi:TVP38/TMEM64 family protein [Oceanobacillus sp. J11TS1]|uniref:TVP38/TMEM64 family protein n=1 Tax=Oceanobacillus sp. J11TS1 TaxID=2807191 RepID=UPI001B052FB0|nr:TVP38/TMEM64 family protein [Oceanobacillus sp. J11TS1]GIO21651.1 putative membrane protein YhjE [Oceanobacillus sp. J11TS1]
MYVMNITFSNWQAFLKEEGWEEFIRQLLEQYEGLGPLPGIALPFLEAFLPFLPLIVFVLGNAAAYGLFQGFLYSWLGASAGAVIVFLVIRRLGNTKLLKRVRHNRQVNKITNWVEKHGFGPLFLLLCFPFSPSSIINVVAGLSKISIYPFLLAVLLGKTVMIFSISYIGSSIMEFAQKPVRTILVGIGIVIFWIFGKYLEKRLHHKMDKQNAGSPKK